MMSASSNTTDLAMRVAIDATPVLGKPTGVGLFAEKLIRGLQESEAVSQLAYALSVRRVGRLGSRLGHDVATRSLPFPPSALMKRWSAHDTPSIDALLSSPDVVHGTNFFVPPAEIRSSSKSVRKSVITVHDLTCLRMPHLCTGTTLMYPALISRAIANGAFVHTPTRAVADEVLSEFDVDSERVVPIHLGFDAPTEVTVGDGDDIDVEPWGDEYVVAVGTVEPRKNYPHLIEAFAVLARRRKRLHLVIVGQRGWDIERTEAAIKASGCEDRIHLTGWVSVARRHRIISGARTLAFVSFYEGFGFPPLEAMALDVPVVVGSVPAVSEVCGGAGINVVPTDVSGICEALDSVIDDSAQRRRMIQEGKDRLHHFSWEKTTREMVELYSKACAS